MLEKDIENLIASHPDEIFPGEGFNLIKQQYTIKGKRIDILFEDKLGRKVIVEVKRGILGMKASGQVLQYFGLLKEKFQDEFFELILVANVVPEIHKKPLEFIGITCVEVGTKKIQDLAKKYDYTLIEDTRKKGTTTSPELPEKDEEVSVWIFQANPKKWDIEEALRKNIKEFEWRVTAYKSDIEKGHLGIIWKSGKDAGIYAITRIECNPRIITLDPDEEDKFNRGLSQEKDLLRVELTVLKNMINKPILKSDLLEIEETKDLSIIKFANATNFPVTDRQWRAIAELL